MAIQISGTTVIDNANQIINATGAVVTGGAGIVTATSFSGAGGNLTGIFQGINYKKYTGSGTFVVGTDCPAQITQIRILCMGGGGNGGTTPAPGPTGWGGGGGASVLGVATRTVSNGQPYSITVGGAAGTSSVVLPTGPTTVISVPGGISAPSANSAGGGGAPTTPTGADYVFVGGSAIGPVFAVGYGGSGTPGDNTNSLYGFGAPSVWGYGGIDQNSITYAPKNAQGYGAGGGGGKAPPVTLPGGTGSPGIVIIEW